MLIGCPEQGKVAIVVSVSAEAVKKVRTLLPPAAVQDSRLACLGSENSILSISSQVGCVLPYGPVIEYMQQTERRMT